MRSTVGIVPAIGMVAGLAGAASAQHHGEDPRAMLELQHVALPDQPWCLELKIPGGTSRDIDELKPDGRALRIQGSNEKTGLTVSAWIVPIPPDGWVTEGSGASARRRLLTPAEFRDLALKRSPAATLPPARAPTLTQSATKASYEYEAPPFPDAPFVMHHLYVFFVHGDRWIDIHVSKTGFRPADQPSFDAIRTDARILEPFQPTTWHHLFWGYTARNAGDWSRTATQLGKALALEQAKPTLSKKWFRVLVDDAGIAQAQAGDVKGSLITFQYGISKDPDYPLFRYNVACSKAELGDLDAALVSLREAFARKANLIEGEEMPDPRTDSSFAKYVEDPRFKAVLKELGLG